jgi:urease accessory protein
MTPEHPWLLWQIADSAFPTGGFAHSGGLEAAWQSGEVASAIELHRFVSDAIRQAGHAALPLLNAAHRSPARLDELDEIADTFLTNAVVNRASRVQGRAYAATCARVWPAAALQALDAHARRGPGHYAPIAGAAARALDLPLDSAQRLFLYQTARGMLSAAVRLGIVGPYEAQRLQLDAASMLDAVLHRCRDLDEGDLAQTAPLADILQSTHDRLYSRLFQS